jgi:alpha-tubulin suppressor-like RCC1 family protein
MNCGLAALMHLANLEMVPSTDSYTPVLVTTDVQSVAAGGYHSLISKTDNTLWTSGFNPAGQLGDGSFNNKNTFIAVSENVKATSAGLLYSVVLKTDNTIWSFGSNIKGQLGDGTLTNRATLVQLYMP